MTAGIEDEWNIDWRCKSFPPSAQGMSSSQIADAKWQLHNDFSTPVAALKETALAHNLDRMRRFCANHDVQIAPHGKTTMSPELISRQLEHGAWGMTAATAWQARAMLNFGAPRVIIANESLDFVGLPWIAEHMRDRSDVEVLVFVDSLEAVEGMRSILRDGVSNGGRALPVLVEVGVAGGRAGVREVAAAVEVGRAVAAAPELELAGVAGFEGILGASRVPEVVDPVRKFLGEMRQTAEELMRADAFRAGYPVILTAGGSAFFDEVVNVFTAGRDQYQRPVEVVIRSGCYITHDHGVYSGVSPFIDNPADDFWPAAQVWGRVLSTPEPGLAITDVGKRDISTDGQMPTVLGRLRDGGYTDIAELGAGGGEQSVPVLFDHANDQHGFLHVTDSRPDVLRVGDFLAFGISHPCTTFDKWRVIPVVDDDYRVVSAVRTFF